MNLEQARDANNKFKYYRDKEAEAEAFREASEAKQRQILVIMTCVFALMLLIIIYLQNKRRMENKIRMHEEKIKQQTEAIHKQELNIAEQSNTLHDKEKALSEKEQEIKRFHKEISKKDKEIVTQEKAISQLNKRVAKSSAMKANKAIINYFQEQSTRGVPTRIDEAKWKELQSLVSAMYPKLMKAVWERKPSIKDEELCVICLLKVGFKTNEIVRMVKMSRTSVYRFVLEAKTLWGDLLLS